MKLRYVLNFFTECITSHFRIILIKSRNCRQLFVKNKVTKKFNDDFKINTHFGKLGIRPRVPVSAIPNGKLYKTTAN